MDKVFSLIPDPVPDDEIIPLLEPNVNIRDPWGYTPLHYACKYQRSSLVKFLLQKGADVNVVNYHGTTPLHLACENDPSIVEYLVYHGALVNVFDRDGFTPLLNACRHEPSVVEFLVKQGAYVNVKTKYGYSPLSIALSYSPYSVECLLTYGANIETSIHGQDPLHWVCIHWGSETVIQALYKRTTSFTKQFLRILQEDYPRSWTLKMKRVMALYAGMCWKRSEVGGLSSRILTTYLYKENESNRVG
jgi:hypothetical protein